MLILPAKVHLTVFGDIFVVTAGGWEVLLTSGPQHSEAGTQPTEHRAATQVCKVMLMSILW
jgi:hypothetical protein